MNVLAGVMRTSLTPNTGMASASSWPTGIEIDNNTVERTIRPIALNRKNALFAGHNAGAENWATIASLIETCKLNAVDPLAYMTATLTAIVNGHKQDRVDELLPWSFTAK